jgi:plasmid stability protein
MSRQLTVRDVKPDLHDRLRAVAESRGESLNRTVLSILEQAVGSDERRKRLERYATWTEEQAKEFDDNLAFQRQIDDEAWR